MQRERFLTVEYCITITRLFIFILSVQLTQMNVVEPFVFFTYQNFACSEAKSLTSISESSPD